MVLNFRRTDVNPSTCTADMSGVITENSFTACKSTDGSSILKMLEQVMLQVEYNCFADRHLNCVNPLYKELCLIIAEVFVLDQNSVIKINGSNIPAHLAKEVFSQIRYEHVCLVFDNYRNVKERIFNKRAYIRTALYNAVFEIESHYANDIRLTY